MSTLKLGQRTSYYCAPHQHVSFSSSALPLQLAEENPPSSSTCPSEFVFWQTAETTNLPNRHFVTESQHKKRGMIKSKPSWPDLKHIRWWFEMQFKSNICKCNTAWPLRIRFQVFASFFFIAPHRTHIWHSKKSTEKDVEQSQNVIMVHTTMQCLLT